MAQTAIRAFEESRDFNQRIRVEKHNYQLPNRRRECVSAVGEQIKEFAELNRLACDTHNFAIPAYSVEDISENDFINYINLALGLGLDSEVDSLLSQTKLTDLTPFLNSILDNIQKKVEEKTKTLKQQKVISLINALNKDGFCITLEQYLDIENDLSSFVIEPNEICFTTNSADGAEDIYLAVRPTDTGCFIIDGHSDEDLSRSIYALFEKISHLSMIMVDDDVLEITPDYFMLMDHVGENFITEHTSRSEFLQKAIENEAHVQYEMDIDEFEDTYEILTDVILNKFHNQKQNEELDSNISNKCALLQWFYKEVNELKDTETNIVQITGHYFSLQFCNFDINSCEILDQMSQELGEFCENQSKIILDFTAMDIVDFLSKMAMSRYLFNVYLTLLSFGKSHSCIHSPSLNQFTFDKIKHLPRIL